MDIRKKWRLPEDPLVRQIEEILSAAAVQSHALPAGGSPLAVSNALWICACYSDGDAPTWLIYDLDGGGVAWCRVPSRIEPLDLVAATSSAGGHADPAGVLAWLHGSEPDPWTGGDGWGDTSAIEELGRRVRAGLH